jgi:hypothetical protein
VTPLSHFQREPDGELVSPGESSFDTEEEEQAWIAEKSAERQRRMLERGPAWERWCDPADGLRTVRALKAALGPEIREVLDCLAVVEQILVIAEREHRRWRLLAFW